MTDGRIAAQAEPTLTGRLTTHVLDTMAGRPAAGVRVQLVRLQSNSRDFVCETVTNADGRVDVPLLAGAAMLCGSYEISFYAGDYFRNQGIALPEPAFLDVVPIRFGIADAGAHYHVPLLIAPFAYSTYRGS